MHQQAENTEHRLRELFDPDFFALPRADFQLQAKELGTVLAFYARRAIRYGLLGKAEGDAALTVIEKLDEGYRLDTRLIGVMFERGGTGVHEDEEEPGFRVHRFGGDVAQRLLAYAVGRHNERTSRLSQSSDLRGSDAPSPPASPPAEPELESFQASVSIRRSVLATKVEITLGDYIDRGPDSFGVLDCLISKPFPAHYIALKGNHEALLGAFLQDPTVGLRWLRLGGMETLSSYGLAVPSTVMQGNCHEIADQLRALIPLEHLRFLKTLKTSLNWGKYFLCHAGIRPGVPFELQSEDDLLWIRDEFLSSQANFGKLVVHGHTPTEWPEIRPNRINIDTGAFASGRLTCVVLENESRRFLQTS